MSAPDFDPASLDEFQSEEVENLQSAAAASTERIEEWAISMKEVDESMAQKATV